MAATFIIKDKSKNESSVYLYVRFKGKQFKKYTGEVVNTKHWNQKKKRCNNPKEYPRGKDVNDILAKIELAVEKTILHFKSFMEIPDPDTFWDKFDSLYYVDYGKEKKEKILLTDYLDYFIKEANKRLSPNTMKKYSSTLSRLKVFEGETGRSIALTDVDIKFYSRLQEWAYKKGYAANYFGVFINVIKRVINEAAYEGLCDTKGISHKDFVTVNEQTESIYLNEEELKGIYELNITPELVREVFYKNEDGTYQEILPTSMTQKIDSLNLVRDRFLIGAYTGLRVSDYGRLGEINFGKKNITVRTVKTDTPVVIPIHPYVKAVFERGFDPSKRVSDQKMNQHIKEVARLAGITERVLIHENKGGKIIPVIQEKYKLVCTHTARRSFATNAYKAGVPTISIMKITGHTNESTFLRYIKVSAEENAELLASHPFFGVSID